MRHLGVGALEDDAARGERGEVRRGARRQPIGAHGVDGDEEDVGGAEVRAVGQGRARDGDGRPAPGRRGAVAQRADERRRQDRALEDDGAQRALAVDGGERGGAGGDGDEADERGVARLDQAHEPATRRQRGHAHGELRGSEGERAEAGVEERVQAHEHALIDRVQKDRGDGADSGGEPGEAGCERAAGALINPLPQAQGAMTSASATTPMATA